MTGAATPDWVGEGRRAVAQAKTLVLKIGSAVLTDGGDTLDEAYLAAVASTIIEARRKGRRILVVSSGAIGAGLSALGLDARPSDVSLLQAAAAAGQPLLMDLWRAHLASHAAPVAQLLLTRADFDSRERYLNIRNCASALHERGAIAVVNENDTVATDEISLGDNDVLAAKLAVAVQAQAMVILTSAPGVLGADGERVAHAADASALLPLVRPERSHQGRGGMRTKIEAARIASGAGIACVIAPGRPSEGIAAVLAGEDIGTLVYTSDKGHRGRRRWIAVSATPAGTIDVDDGAARAVRERQASLLAKGVVGCEGRFEIGDVVSVRDSDGREVGRGLVNLAAGELRAVMGRESSDFEEILGRRAHQEVIHRDNLALVDGAGA